MFPGPRVVVFCDGDFWHGRDLESRLATLERGHNGAYWSAKIRRNVERDRANVARLESDGWLVLRFWETDILKAPDDAARAVAEAVRRSVARRAKVTTPSVKS